MYKKRDNSSINIDYYYLEEGQQYSLYLYNFVIQTSDNIIFLGSLFY